MFTIEIIYEDGTETIQGVTEYWINQGCLWAIIGKSANRAIRTLDKVVKIDVEYNKK